MVRIKYDPRVMKLLIEESANKAGLSTKSTDLITLSTIVSNTLKLQENDKRCLKEKYIDSLYRDCKNAIQEEKPITREDYKISSLLKYVEVESFEEYNEVCADKITKIPKVSDENISQFPKPKTHRKNDVYDRKARILPLSFGMLPIISLVIVMAFDETISVDMSPLKISGIACLSLTGIFYLIISSSDVVSGLSKVYQNKYFIKKSGFPSTYLMLYSDPTFSGDYKDQYREKVFRLFNLKLLGKEDENNNNAKAIQSLNAATDYVKQYVFEGLVKTQNIRYGFTRNLIGAVILGIPFTLMEGVIGILLSSIPLILLSLVFLSIFILILSFKKHLLHEAAEGYAKELFSCFMVGGGV